MLAVMIAEQAVIFSMNHQNDDALLAYLQAGSYINIRNAVGWTPLIYFAHHGNVHALMLLLRSYDQLDANFSDNDGWTALHHAAYNGNYPVIHHLMRNGFRPVDMRLRTRHGATASDIAHERGHTQIAQTMEKFAMQKLSARGDL